MPIIKKSFGKNYLQCYESEKGKTYSCEQIRKSWVKKYKRRGTERVCGCLYP